MSRLLVAQRALTVPGWAKNVLWRSARAVPSLDLRFADNKSLVDAVTGASLVTFTRASSGTFVGSNGVLQTASTNVPRFDHNPTTGESLGLLVEESRTNLQTFSEEFNNAAYGGSAGSVSGVNEGIAPNGTSTADEITSTGGGIFRPLTVVTATVYTASVYAKYVSGGASFFFGCDSNPSTAKTVFNLQTGVITSNGANVTSSSITPARDNWYRCTVTFTTTSASIILAYYNATSGSKYLVWGAQLEAGAFPTSYIPTTSATVTRAADVASITGTNFSSWYNQTEGTVFAEFGPYGNSATKNPGIIQIDSGSVVNTIRMFCGGSASPVLNVETSSVGQVYISSGLLTPSAISKISGSYKINDFARAANGSNLGTYSSGSVPTVSQMLIGTGNAGVSELNGTIKRLTFWPQRLPNSTLQALTQ